MHLSVPFQTDDYIQLWPTGSAYIGTIKPPADRDFLIRVAEDECESYCQRLVDGGWQKLGAGEGYSVLTGGGWAAFRKDDLNAIVCSDDVVYLRWVAFTELARVCAMAAKVERIELCKAVLEGDATAANNILRTHSMHSAAKAREDLI